MKRSPHAGFAALEQIAGFQRYELREGLENGVEIIEVRSGGGLRFGVCPSRALDIVFAELNGVNLTWRHPNGTPHPAFYGAENFDWTRGAPSGLLTTCGLQSFGPPCEVDGETFGLHDCISYLPAREISTRILEIEGEMHFEIVGSVRQTRLFGANLRLQRTIRVKFGSNEIRLRDKIFNDGFADAPFCVLYHCNFGFPLLETGARVAIDSVVTPRDADAQRGLATWSQIEAPQNDYREQVFFHQIAPHEAGSCRAALWNTARELGVEIEFAAAQLPYFTQWKMLGAGCYVLGLEPSNAPLASRAELLKRNEMPSLAPGESREFEVAWNFVTQISRDFS